MNRGLYQRYKLILALGKWQRLDSQVNGVTRVLVSVTEGVLDLWDGDFSNPSGAPDYRFRAGNPPGEIWINRQEQFVMTALAVDRDTKATVTFVRGGF